MTDARPGSPDAAARRPTDAPSAAGVPDRLDLHVDTFIWQRLFGGGLKRRGHANPSFPWLAGHSDLERLEAAGYHGACWVITTWPFASGNSRVEALISNVGQLRAELTRAGATPVRTLDEYQAARTRGEHAAFLAVQGGNAFGDDRASAERALAAPHVADLVRVTLVHLTRSAIGSSSTPLVGAPFQGTGGLTPFGRELVELLDDRGILVDLAHANAATFWDALTVLPRHRPVLVSHTGVSAVHRHFRNLDDKQLRAVADRDGVVGILFHGPYLGARTVDAVATHVQHALRTIGARHVALGSDWDGATFPPRELASPAGLPCLLHALAARGVSEDELRTIQGASFLRLVAAARR